MIKNIDVKDLISNTKTIKTNDNDREIAVKIKRLFIVKEINIMLRDILSIDYSYYGKYSMRFYISTLQKWVKLENEKTVEKLWQNINTNKTK